MTLPDRNHLGSPDRFGYEWNKYSDVSPESLIQFKRWLGSLSIESFRGLEVLDVGCGMGRNPYWILHSGAGRVVAADVDDQSLAAARKTLAPFNNAQVIKCSVYDLSEREPGKFDRVTCVGVLHHLADPEAALKAMWSCVRPGGQLILWCYGREGNGVLLPFINLIRSVGSRLPLLMAHLLAQLITPFVWIRRIFVADD